MLSIHNVEMGINRLGLSKSDPNSTFDELGTERVAMLHSCVQAVKNFLDAYLEIPVLDYAGIPVTVYAQFTHAIGTVHLLSTFECPGWDPSDVVSFVDIRKVLAKKASNFAMVKSTLGYDKHTSEGLDEFSAVVSRFTALKNWVESSLPTVQPVAAALEEDDSYNMHKESHGFDTAYYMDYLESLDNAWISDMFDWGYQAT